jgi:hypothetical protein
LKAGHSTSFGNSSDSTPFQTLHDDEAFQRYMPEGKDSPSNKNHLLGMKTHYGSLGPTYGNIFQSKKFSSPCKILVHETTRGSALKGERGSHSYSTTLN